ncbi:MAG: XdhC family protein [Sedimentisphaerales bacterium]|nr:XdhC family protein [Sedimentisphaerales bacterium]
MDNLETFQKAATLLRSGEHVAVVTVVSAIGSTPGKAGYKMLVWDHGEQTFGTVGGGLVEAEMIEQAARMLSRPGSRTFRFDLGDATDDEKGICGGAVELLVETFDEEALPLFHDVVEAADCDEPAVLLSIISPEAPPRKMLIREAALSATIDAEFSSEIVSAMKAAVAGAVALRVSTGDSQAFVERVVRRPTVVLFGAGHLSYHIARHAKAVDFRVTVYDDRGEYTNAERFPEADEIIVADFGCVLDNVRIDQHSHLVIVTRGHEYDEIVLEQVLRTDAKYIGMIGSRRKTQTIMDRLRQRGVGAESLTRVFSPIGLHIGAVTPEEIALSIVCELVKVRRLGPAPGIGHLALSRSGSNT